jgi:hypothetical protein
MPKILWLREAGKAYAGASLKRFAQHGKKAPN